MQRNRLLVALTAALLILLNAVHWFHLEPMAGGLRAPDVIATGITYAGLEAWLNALGPDGRMAMLGWHSLTLDLVFPALLTLALVRVTLGAARRLTGFAARNKRWQIATVALAPFLYMLADYAENAAVIRVLIDPSRATPGAAGVIAALTLTKYTFVCLSLILLAAFVLAGLRKTDRG